MTPERWSEITKLYHAAREREPGERIAFLAEACRGDEELRREIESLLAQQSEGGVLSIPAVEWLDEPADLELRIGAELGQYRILEHLGAGGMGTVYRATDTKPGRQVALKLLRREMLADDGAQARFVREARALAALNHSCIATIFGFEEHNGVRFLALEYVAGPTLAERLRSGPLPLRKALQMGKQIAEALEAAHSAGIVHRDLKPANIKVSDSGQVKVLDFGLAKWVERPEMILSADSTATVTEKLTHSMMIMGTAAYMSPEQASGKDVDSRTDIWSFGCVLYEVLAGKRAFAGATVTEILAAVLKGEPEWTALPGSIPVLLTTLLRRCLRKEMNTRLRDIGDARIELEDLLGAPVHAETAHRPPALTRRTMLSALSGAAAGAAGTAVFAISRYRGLVLRKLTRFTIAVPEGTSIPTSFARRVAISPDGSRLAYVVASPTEVNRFYVRSFRELDGRFVLDGGSSPFFSPNGQWLAFQRMTRDKHVAKIALGGGPPAIVSPNQLLFGGTWAEDDTIYADLIDTSGLAAIPAAGGPPKAVLKVDLDKGERQPKSPYAIRGSRAILLVTANADTETYDDARIIAFQPHTGERQLLVEGGMSPRYSPTGHLLYARDGKILAIRFDADRLKVSGQPFTVLEGVMMSRNSSNVNYDISASSDLVYVPGSCDGGARTLVWVDRNGNAKPLGLPPKSYLHPRLSPSGNRLAIEIEGPNHDIYVYDFDRAVLAKITNDGASHFPVWSPDGMRIAFRQGPMGEFKLEQTPVDRSTPPEPVPAEGPSQSADSWSPDGRELLYTVAGPGEPPRIMAVPVKGGSPRPLQASKFAEGSPKFSPDGRWVTYCSAESGKPQVFVDAYPGPGLKIQISSEGGTDPVWKRDGSELYYRNGDSMMAVTVSTVPTFRAGRPQELWEGHYSHGMSSSCGPPGATSSNYDVTADGRRFLMIKDDDQDRAVSKQIVVVLGWAGEVSRMAAQA
jgi:Tol biopolymer transport system component